MEIKTFKIRCSAIGKIMSEPKNKADKEAGLLGETAKTYCENWLKEQIYDRKIEIQSKYLQKGIDVEQESIELINHHFQVTFKKNEKMFENDFMKGTPDINDNDFIIDMKNSYDFSTFPLFDTEIENKDYEYQLQGYMHLCNKKNAMLIYTLIDLPENLITKEVYRYCNFNNIEYNQEIEMKIRGDYTYIDIPNKYKIKILNTSYKPEVIEKIESQVIKCRNYINQLIKNL